MTRVSLFRLDAKNRLPWRLRYFVAWTHRGKHDNFPPISKELAQFLGIPSRQVQRSAFVSIAE
jgi:hypothetical protein